MTKKRILTAAVVTGAILGPLLLFGQTAPLRKEQKEPSGAAAKPAPLRPDNPLLFTNRIRKAVDQLQNHVNRLGQLADRVEERIKKFEERGLNMSESRQKMAEARAAIQRAGQAVENLRQTAIQPESATSTPSATSPNEQQQGLANFRVRVQGVKNVIREAQAAVVGVIRSMKVGLLTAEQKRQQNQP